MRILTSILRTIHPEPFTPFPLLRPIDIAHNAFKPQALTNDRTAHFYGSLLKSLSSQIPPLDHPSSPRLQPTRIMNVSLQSILSQLRSLYPTATYHCARVSLTDYHFTPDAPEYEYQLAIQFKLKPGDNNCFIGHGPSWLEAFSNLAAQNIGI